jgi:hypothetical protein
LWLSEQHTQKFNSFKVVFKKINLSFKLEGGLGASKIRKMGGLKERERKGCKTKSTRKGNEKPI